MKEFEKWRDEQHTGTGIYTTAAIRKGWKAALRWVANECESLDDVCCLGCGCFGMVQNKIDEELGDE